MKRFTIVVLLAVVLFAVVAQAQAQTPAQAKPISQSEAIALKMQNIQLVFQKFQELENNVIQIVPDFKEAIQAMVQAEAKRLGDVLKDLQTQFDAAKKAEAPVKK
jgi:hypothetical protein